MLLVGCGGDPCARVSLPLVEGHNRVVCEAGWLAREAGPAEFDVGDLNCHVEHIGSLVE